MVWAFSALLRGICMDELLKYLVESGKVDLLSIHKQMEMSKRQELLNGHKYKIWQASNGEWKTYLPDEEKGRVLKKRTTKKNLENLIIAFYEEKSNNPTINELFLEWLDRRIEYQEIEDSTYSRYKTDFDRCLKNNLGKMKIKSVQAIDIENGLKKCIQEKKMSRKSFSNIRTLLYGVFRYAKKKGLINYNIKDIISEIEFSKKEFTKITHEDCEQVFFVDDEEAMIKYMKDNLDVINLGILLMFKSGIRVGELAALKSSDLDGNEVHIRRTETRYKDRETGKIIYAVKDHPKTEAGIRDVIIPNDSLWILKELKKNNPFGEYLFEKNGIRINSYVFRQRIYSNCKKTGTCRKGPHKVRKTYGSRLYDSDIPKALLMSQMGHTDITCLEKHYYYNRYDKERITDAINNVFSM